MPSVVHTAGASPTIEWDLLHPNAAIECGACARWFRQTEVPARTPHFATTTNSSVDKLG